MPEQKVTKTITYSDAELEQLVIKDLTEKGLYKEEKDKLVRMRELQRQEGSIPIGNFDEDPYYVFAGVELTIEAGI